jgi:hypothetical protein
MMGHDAGWCDSLWMEATLSIFCLPKTAAISMSASVSSFELKIGNFRVKMDNRMMPADQMSMAGGRKVVTRSVASQTTKMAVREGKKDRPTVWSGHLSSTSGARNPRVPARFALTLGL